MAKYGYSDRKDMSLGMRNGKESKMKQSYKDRRDESYGMSKEISEKTMGHEKMPKRCDAFAAQKFDVDRVKRMPKERLGTPSQAFDYDY